MRPGLVGRRTPEVGTAAPDRPPCYRWVEYTDLRGTIRRQTMQCAIILCGENYTHHTVAAVCHQYYYGDLSMERDVYGP